MTVILLFKIDYPTAIKNTHLMLQFQSRKWSKNLKYVIAEILENLLPGILSYSFKYDRDKIHNIVYHFLKMICDDLSNALITGFT
jgi:hypothetical protein